MLSALQPPRQGGGRLVIIRIIVAEIGTQYTPDDQFCPEKTRIGQRWRQFLTAGNDLGTVRRRQLIIVQYQHSDLEHRDLSKVQTRAEFTLDPWSDRCHPVLAFIGNGLYRYMIV